MWIVLFLLLLQFHTQTCSYASSLLSCPSIEGFYCPIGTSSSRPCGKQAIHYCPAGSEHPLLTALGYYASSPRVDVGGGYGSQSKCPRGSYCVDGVRFDCPSGRFGSTEKMTNPRCTDACPAGWYCPAGSTRGMQVSCGDRSVFCPKGSGAPVRVDRGSYSVGYENQSTTLAVGVSGDSNYLPTFSTSQMTHQTQCRPGSYCEGGIRVPCPSGRYGAASGLSGASCTGACAEGFYCPSGSTRAAQVPCGGDALFCPVGTGLPLSVTAGYYSVGGADNRTRTAERKCEPGSFAEGGVRKLCPAGRWGGAFGATNSSCSGPCSEGFFCPAGSTRAQEVECGDAARYCVAGSASPAGVDRGYYSSGGVESTRTGQTIAPAGFYAVQGLLYRCRAATYGASEGLSSPACSGACDAPGFYCPAGAVSPRMRACGGDDRYCPAKTAAPIPVSAGCYTTDYLYAECPPGMWRNVSGLAVDATRNDFSAVPTSVWPPCQLCPPNTFKIDSGDEVAKCVACPDHSVSSAARTTCQCTLVIDRAPDAGSSSAMVFSGVSSGVGGLLSFTALERSLGLSLGAQGQPTNTDETLVFNTTSAACMRMSRALAVLLDDGYISQHVSLTRSTETACEPGRYCLDGLRFLCPPGRYSSSYRETNPLCSGPCRAGYYCTFGASSPFGVPCGNSSLICPEGSGAPLLVPAGFYSNTDVLESLRSAMTKCEKGSFCPGDGKRHLCPAGRFADEEGTYAAMCLGPCAPGYFCPPGSASAKQELCGGSAAYCPTGSSLPTLVHEGFYSVHTGPDALARRTIDPKNATMSAEIPCEPGYYCTGGVKHPCGPGTYNWRHGLSSSGCPLCAAGYYCPSYLTPQPADIAPLFTVWPQKPQIVANAYPCGSVAYYCPRGSPYPTLTPAGFYTDGGNGTVRTESKPCPAGTYCTNGKKVPCPRGRYGGTPGLTTAFCTRECPAGYYCPPGTAVPQPCLQNQYAVAGSWNCMQCPGAGAKATPMPCHTDKGCCFKMRI